MVAKVLLLGGIISIILNKMIFFRVSCSHFYLEWLIISKILSIFAPCIHKELLFSNNKNQ